MIDPQKLAKAADLAGHYSRRFSYPASLSMSFNEDGSIVYNFCTLKDSIVSHDLDDLITELEKINAESKSMEFFRLGVK
jgi:hypothetical protein